MPRRSFPYRWLPAGVLALALPALTGCPTNTGSAPQTQPRQTSSDGGKTHKDDTGPAGPATQKAPHIPGGD
jgi:hypothetical protein